MKNVLDISHPSVDDSNSNITRVSLVSSGGGSGGADASQFQGNAAAGSASVGNPVRVGATVVPVGNEVTRSNGQVGNLAVTEKEFLKVQEQLAPKYEDGVNGVAKVEQRFSYSSTTGAATTTHKSGGGLLHSIVITGGTAGTIDVYDNTAGSGNKIATFTSTNALSTHVFDTAFMLGLTVVTGAATNLTVTYR